MNTLHAAIRTSFPHQNPPFSFTHQRRLLRRRNPTARSRSSDEDTGRSDGDKRKQDLLAQIAMLQTQKVRLTDYLDERSSYLTQFAEEAGGEFEKIGENALKELDKAEARIMENLEKRMEAFEETAEANRQEMEENEKALEDFEEKIDRDRNEGLFFKNLSERSPVRKAEAKVEAKAEARKLQETTRETAGSKTRRNFYLALISLLAIMMGNAVISSPEVEWRKVAAMGLIFIGLIAQLIYEQSLSSCNYMPQIYKNLGFSLPSWVTSFDP